MALVFSAVALAIAIAQEQVYGSDKEPRTDKGYRKDGWGHRESSGGHGGGHSGGYSQYSQCSWCN